jgi:hypothetical protein
MEGPSTHWERIAGDGMVYDGPCTVRAIIFEPYAANDYVNVYDGRDAISGKLFCQIFTSVKLMQCVDLGAGVEFGRGIYVDGIDGDVRTTVTFTPHVNTGE